VFRQSRNLKPENQSVQITHTGAAMHTLVALILECAGCYRHLSPALFASKRKAIPQNHPGFARTHPGTGKMHPEKSGDEKRGNRADPPGEDHCGRLSGDSDACSRDTYPESYKSDGRARPDPREGLAGEGGRRGVVEAEIGALVAQLRQDADPNTYLAPVMLDAEMSLSLPRSLPVLLSLSLFRSISLDLSLCAHPNTYRAPIMLDAGMCALNSNLQTPNPKTLKPKPQTPNPKTQTPNPKTPNPNPKP